MRDLFSRVFRLNVYKDPIQRFRAVGTYATATALFLISFLAIAILFGSVSSEPSRDSFSLFSRVFSVGIAIGTIVAILLTRSGQQRMAAYILSLVWFFIGWSLVFLPGPGSENFYGGFTVILVGVSLLALLIGPLTVVAGVAISVVVIIAAIIVNKFGPSSYLNVLLIIVEGVITYSLSNTLPAVVRQVVANAEQRRLRLVEASNTITGKLLAARLDLETLYKETIQLIGNISTDIHTVQLYIVDSERRNATLVASTQPDKATLGQQVGIGSLNIVGRSTITGQTILVRDTADERAYRREAFVQGTRSQLVLPLHVGEETIGVLDVQSQNSAAFAADDVKTLETLANQIATVIDNARLYANAQSQLAENQKLYRQARNSLREIERLNQQLTGSAWSEYLRGQAAAPAYTIDLVTGQVENVADWTQSMADASRRNQIMVRQAGQARVLTMPISVRGQPIGAMEFELPPAQEISNDQMNVLQQVMERLGLAIENTRLFEETQRIAQREALVNEISARMQVTTNVEAVIAAATQSLADAFHAPRVAIRLGNPTSSAAVTDGSQSS